MPNERNSELSTCRISNAPLVEFIDFGKMPLGNGFLSEEEFDDEYFYRMRAGFCEESKMVQLIDQPAPEQMFHDHYAFFTSTSAGMCRHFRSFADAVRARYLTSDNAFAVEIGSNDGTFLSSYAEAGIRHLGVEPSANVAQAARERGVQTISEFFSPALAEKIVKENGTADTITAANVICHIPDFNGVLAGVSILLKKGGVFIFEDPYLGSVVEKTSYDQFYDEHVFMFSAMSVAYAASRHGLALIEVEPQTTHGGSMRYTLCHAGEKTVGQSVEDQLAKEQVLGLDTLAAYEKFRGNCENSKHRLMEVLEDMKMKGLQVAGYAATSKSTTVINYCGITRDHLSYICDTTPIKQGKFSPGAHIPVVPYEVFKNNPPPCALLLAWNHAEEIMAKEAEYTRNGGKWIRFVPEVTLS
jgi:methylation protein EvaC